MPDYHYPSTEQRPQNVEQSDVWPSRIFTNRNDKAIEISNLTQFAGYYDNRYVDPFTSGYSLLFMTKPNLFIDPIKQTGIVESLAYENMERDPFFVQFLEKETLNAVDLEIAKMLSYNIKYRKSSFIPIITNYSRSLSPSGVQLDKLVDFNTKEGYNMNLPTNTTASNSGSTFQLDLPETQNLDITKMMSLWVKYMENIGNGTFNPNPDMVRLRKLDFMSSLFYFVFEPDGRTLKYWVKFTGCFPTEIPSSSLGYLKGSSDAVTISIPFQYNVKEEMDPDILKEFNILSLGLLGIEHFKNDITDNHTSFQNSKFLTPEGIDEILGVSGYMLAPDRDPLIIFNPKSEKGLLDNSPTSTRLQLLFAPNTNERSFAKKTFGDDYLVSLSAFDRGYDT